MYKFTGIGIDGVVKPEPLADALHSPSMTIRFGLRAS